MAVNEFNVERSMLNVRRSLKNSEAHDAFGFCLDPSMAKPSPNRSQNSRSVLLAPQTLPLTRPPATLSPIGGEGRGEGVVHGLNACAKRKEAPHEQENIQHRTPNAELRWQRESSLTSAFDVRCSTFDVFPRLRGFNARMFISRKSLPQ